jgi:hypothetical protein
MPWDLTGNANTDSTVNFVGTTDQQALSIRTNNQAAVLIDTSGNVGIGTQSPTNQLHVGPGSSSIAAGRVNAVVASDSVDAGIAIAQNNGVNVLLQTSTAAGFLGTTSNHPVALITNDRNRLVVDVNGNVGIGTASPQNLLQVGLGSSSIAASRVNAVVASDNQDAGIAIAQNSGVNVLLQGSTAGGFLGTTSNHPVVLRTNDLDRMIVDVNGNIGIGTSTPGAKLEIDTDLGQNAVTAVHTFAGGGSAVFASAVGETAIGVFSTSLNWEAVHAETQSSHTAAVAGYQLFADGTGAGVYGDSKGKGPGVVGESDNFDGVFGISHNPNTAGVSGHNTKPDGSDNPGGLAGFFGGNVIVTGDISLPGADCAEHFDTAGARQIEPGTVVVIDEDGALRESSVAYDRKVAGVVSGAGAYRPGIVLDGDSSRKDRALEAVVGKVYCKADARHGPIELGDLLTTSPTPGHAMRAGDPTRAFGAVIGKALWPMSDGCGLIPMLVALQ